MICYSFGFLSKEVSRYFKFMYGNGFYKRAHSAGSLLLNDNPFLFLPLVDAWTVEEEIHVLSNNLLFRPL